MRRIALLFGILGLLAPAAVGQRSAVAGPSDPISVEPVTFAVTNDQAQGGPASVRGFLYRPASPPDCSGSVLLLLHGTAGGRWGWDFPVRPEKYSVARALAAAGYPAVAIDELGYGSSDHPNGHSLTIPAYAAITSQIIEQLRAGSYQAASPVRFAKVGLAGHSAGAEVAELTAGAYGGIDLLLILGYTHFISQEVGRVFVAEEQPRALQSDYVFFWGTRERVHRFHHNPAYIDPDVLAKVDELTNLTPSGIVLSIGNQPSRDVMGTIRVPLLMVLSEKDTIFPVEQAPNEMALFASAADKTLHIVPKAGHTFQLEPNAPETNAVIVSWLRNHGANLFAC
jgi:pimeloyl-ACP methyl ester carboxylesterase